MYAVLSYLDVVATEGHPLRHQDVAIREANDLRGSVLQVRVPHDRLVSAVCVEKIAEIRKTNIA